MIRQPGKADCIKELRIYGLRSVDLKEFNCMLNLTTIMAYNHGSAKRGT